MSSFLILPIFSLFLMFKHLKSAIKIIMWDFLFFNTNMCIVMHLSKCFFSFFSFLRLLFWAQCGTPAKIERTSLDGRDRKSLVTRLLRHPVALSLGKFLLSHPKEIGIIIIYSSYSYLIIYSPSHLSRCAPSAAVLARPGNQNHLQSESRRPPPQDGG